jgi:hypothetical protein
VTTELAELLKAHIVYGWWDTTETYNQALRLLEGAGWILADPDHHGGRDVFIRIQ